MCRNIFSAFYPILYETFSNSCGFHLIQEFYLFCLHLVLYDRKYLCSILTNLSYISHNRWKFLFHQKFPLLSSDLKNAFTKHFLKMQPFPNVLQRRCYYRFLDIHKKMSVLESLFNKVTGLIACSFIKKETPTQVVSSEYHKKFEKSFFYGTPLVAASENDWTICKNFYRRSYKERVVWFD